MNQFDMQDLQYQSQECFFTKLLRECSMDCNQNDNLNPPLQEKSINQQETKKSNEQRGAVQAFFRWKGLEESDQQDTYEPQPHLCRAKSLRLQQERKISSFIQIFGHDGVDPLTGKLKTFSPQKHKRIIKTKKSIHN